MTREVVHDLLPMTAGVPGKTLAVLNIGAVEDGRRDA
jgi:hypothetical protein